MTKRLLILLFAVFSFSAFAQNLKSDELIPFRSRDNGKIGYGNTSKGVVVQPQYSSGGYDINGYYVVSIGRLGDQDERFGVLDRKGKHFIDFKQGYEFISLSEDNENKELILVRKGGKYGFINYKMKTIIPLVYDNLDFFYGGLAYAEQHDKYGFINKSGEVVIDFKFDRVSTFSQIQPNGKRYAIVEQNDKYGLIDATGTIIIPIVYDFIETLSNDGKIKARKDDEKNKFLTFDVTGKLIKATSKE